MIRTRFEDLSEDYILEVIKSCACKEQFFQRLNLSNGTTNRKKFDSFVEKYQVDITHFSKSWYIKQKVKKYLDIEKMCPQCNQTFTCKSAGKGFKITCSRSCSNIYFSKKRITEESRIKKSLTLIKSNINNNKIGAKSREYLGIGRLCKICDQLFFSSSIKTKTCSRKCADSLRNTTEYRKLLSDKAKKRVLDGKHKGWTKRPIASYAEKYFQFKLNELNIEYKFNFAIPKSSLGLKCASCYFLDFYFPEIKLDLEIDGKQHKIPERKLSDEKRDRLLLENGIKVFRIEWKNPSKKENKDYLDKKFAEFLEIRKNLLDNS